MSIRPNDMIKFREHTSFLGYEFLSWVLIKIAHEPAILETIIGKHFFKTDARLTLGNRLTTCLLNHKEQKTTISCPIMEESHEVYASLKNGHVIEALSLVLSLDEMKINCMVHAQDAAITQVKIQNNFDENSYAEDDGLTEEDQAREDVFLRAKALFDLEKVVDALYEHFLAVRVDAKQYVTTHNEMRALVEKRLADYLHKGQGQNKPLDELRLS